jgi:hypothetical protein
MKVGKIYTVVIKSGNTGTVFDWPWFQGEQVIPDSGNKFMKHKCIKVKKALKPKDNLDWDFVVDIYDMVDDVIVMMKNIKIVSNQLTATESTYKPPRIKSGSGEKYQKKVKSKKKIQKGGAICPECQRDAGASVGEPCPYGCGIIPKRGIIPSTSRLIFTAEVTYTGSDIVEGITDVRYTSPNYSGLGDSEEAKIGLLINGSVLEGWAPDSVTGSKKRKLTSGKKKKKKKKKKQTKKQTKKETSNSLI